MSELGDAAIKLFGKTITLRCRGDEEKPLHSKVFLLNQLHIWVRVRLSLKNRDDLCVSFRSQDFREEENHRTRRKLTSTNRRGTRRLKNDEVMQGVGRRRRRGSRRRSFLVLGAEAPTPSSATTTTTTSTSRGTSAGTAKGTGPPAVPCGTSPSEPADAGTGALRMDFGTQNHTCY
ncbi:hypothetical protein BHE74_00054389 [Ensete ventricosum]|nr:hypothetical protein BHE74_00054389 [Ensete ventricosum]